MFNIVLWVYDTFGCCKQLPVNSIRILLQQKSINGVKLLSDVARGLIVSSDNPLDFHEEIYFALATTLKYLFISWNTK